MFIFQLAMNNHFREEFDWENSETYEFLYTTFKLMSCSHYVNVMS